MEIVADFNEQLCKCDEGKKIAIYYNNKLYNPIFNRYTKIEEEEGDLCIIDLEETNEPNMTVGEFYNQLKTYRRYYTVAFTNITSDETIIELNKIELDTKLNIYKMCS